MEFNNENKPKKGLRLRYRLIYLLFLVVSYFVISYGCYRLIHNNNSIQEIKCISLIIMAFTTFNFIYTYQILRKILKTN